MSFCDAARCGVHRWLSPQRRREKVFLSMWKRSRLLLRKLHISFWFTCICSYYSITVSF